MPAARVHFGLRKPVHRAIARRARGVRDSGAALPMSAPLLALVAALALVVSACTSEDGAKGRDRSTPLYVAIGASDAVGTGSRNPSSDGWVPQLLAKMPQGTRLANLGIGGILLQQAVEQELPVAVDLKPAVVTVWLGVNDFAGGVPLESFRADLDTLLGTLARESGARVYVANLPDLTLLPAFRDRSRADLRARVQEWNAAIAATAESNGAVLVDLYGGWPELRDRPDFISRDGLHPSTLGHKRLAEIFWQAINADGAGAGEQPAAATGDPLPTAASSSQSHGH